MAVRQHVVDYVSYVPEQDSTHVLRLVGFVEYSASLGMLDQFLSVANDEELRIADEIVTERPEFAIYTNLSKKWQGANSFLAEPTSTDNENYRQQGLKWVTALARVEVGAMLAGFTSVPAPFAVKGPTKYDLDAYQEILLDGYRSLYWTIAADQTLGNYANSPIPTSMLLIEGRRIALARAFGTAVINLIKPKLSPVQIAELLSWDQLLQRLEIVILYCVSKTIGVGKGTAEQLDSTVVNCPPIRDAALRAAKPRNNALGGQTLGNRQSTMNVFTALKLQLETLYPTLVTTVKCQ